MNTLGRILIVEDDPRDVELTLTALEEYNLANAVVVTRDGQEALDYLYRRGQFHTRSDGNPAVMLLDLKLPKVDGLEVLKQVRSDEHLKIIQGNFTGGRRGDFTLWCSLKVIRVLLASQVNCFAASHESAFGTEPTCQPR